MKENIYLAKILESIRSSPAKYVKKNQNISRETLYISGETLNIKPQIVFLLGIKLVKSTTATEA
ncbi:6250_t:CDS:2, partial [Entrophospora sp. SA101]